MDFDLSGSDLDDMSLGSSEQMDWMEEAQENDAKQKALEEEQKKIEERKRQKEEEKKAREQARIDLNMTDEEREQYLIKQREQHNKELAENFLSDSDDSDMSNVEIDQGVQRNYDMEDAFFAGEVQEQDQQEEDQNKELKTEQDYKDFGRKMGQLLAKSYNNNHDEYYKQLEDIVVDAIQMLETQDLKALCDFCFLKLSKELSRRK